MSTPTQTQAPNTLDSIMQSMGEMIEKADPEKIRIITERMQDVLPAEDTRVTLRAGSNDEEKRAALTFFLKKVAKADRAVSLADFFQCLLPKIPLEDLAHLGRVLAHLASFEGSGFEWDFVEPHFDDGAGHVCHFFIYKQQP